MSVSILDEIVAELHQKHGEEAGHILPEHRVGTAYPKYCPARYCMIVALGLLPPWLI